MVFTAVRCWSSGDGLSIFLFASLRRMTRVIKSMYSFVGGDRIELPARFNYRRSPANPQNLRNARLRPPASLLLSLPSLPAGQVAK